MNINDALRAREAELASAESEVADLEGQQRSILGAAGDTLSDVQQRTFDAISGQKAAAKARAATARARAEEARALVAEEASRMNAQNQSTPGAERRSYDSVARVGMEARTYRQDEDPTGKGFLHDVTRSHFGDLGARDRLARHMQEETVERGQQLKRATSTSAFAGLVVPQYLVDLVAPKAAALKPFVEAATTKHRLPDEGMTLNISRITTASSVDLQASQGDAVAEQDMDDTLLTVNVQTAAGQQTVSRQAIERGAGIEDVTLGDLVRQYHSKVDNTLINQATTGVSAVAGVTTYTDASPTAAEFYPNIFKAQSQLESALLGLAVPDYVVMHSRRWNWLCSEVGTSFPLISGANMPAQKTGIVVTNEYGGAVRGLLSNGLKVIVDNNVPTNKGAGTDEDEVYVVASDEVHFWEDPDAPLFIRTDEVKAANLQVLLVVYGYFAYTCGRYSSTPAKIGGTGLVAPAGF